MLHQVDRGVLVTKGTKRDLLRSPATQRLEVERHVPSAVGGKEPDEDINPLVQRRYCKDRNPNGRPPGLLVDDEPARLGLHRHRLRHSTISSLAVRLVWPHNSGALKLFLPIVMAPLGPVR